MKIKMIKFSLPLDDKSCKAKEDIAQNFNLPELIDHYKSGRLLLWCKVRELKAEILLLETLKNEINPLQEFDKNKKIAEKLCAIFEVETTNILESIMIYEYINSINNYSVSKQNIVKTIFKEYSDEYLILHKERQLQEKREKDQLLAEQKEKELQEKREKDRLLAEKVKKEKETFLVNIKCIEIEVEEGSIVDNDLLKGIEIIPLYLSYVPIYGKTRSRVAHIRMMHIRDSFKKMLIVKSISQYLDNSNIAPQIESSFSKYESLNGIHLSEHPGQQIGKGVKAFHLYVFDIGNKIKEDNYLETQETKNISEEIFLSIDKNKILTSIESE